MLSAKVPRDEKKTLIEFCFHSIELDENQSLQKLSQSFLYIFMLTYAWVVIL